MKYLFILLLFILNFTVFCQNNSIQPYYLMAYSYIENDLPELNSPFKRRKFYSQILSLERDKFRIVDTLSKGNFELKKIYLILDQKLLYFEEYESSSNNKPAYISFFDYDKKLVLKKYKIDIDSQFTSVGAVYPIFKNGKFILYNEIDGETKQRFGRDRSFKRIKLESEDFNFIIPSGFTGLHRTSNADFYYGYIGENSELVIPYLNSAGNRPKAFIQEPLGYRNNRYMIVLINNENYFVGVPGIKATTNDSTIGIKIFDKTNRTWKTHLVPGLLCKCMNYKNWIFGTAKTDENHFYYLPYDSIDISYKTRYDLSYGLIPELQEFPGILYLYHIPSEKLIKWYTGDRDSEIITINDDVIYYRVFDEIRTVKLDTKRNEIDWASQKVLIRDKKRVPNIHWMFFAPKQDRIKEIWVNKPKEKKKK